MKKARVMEQPPEYKQINLFGEPENYRQSPARNSSTVYSGLPEIVR